jgi:hypothetical protein
MHAKAKMKDVMKGLAEKQGMSRARIKQEIKLRKLASKLAMAGRHMKH